MSSLRQRIAALEDRVANRPPQPVDREALRQSIQRKLEAAAQQNGIMSQKKSVDYEGHAESLKALREAIRQRVKETRHE